MLPGERGAAYIMVHFHDPAEPWAKRKVHVSVRAPADVTVELTDTELTLDDTGFATVGLSITPAKAAPPGPRRLTITVIGSSTASVTSDLEIAVK
jgi:hypothetical protein